MEQNRYKPGGMKKGLHKRNFCSVNTNLNRIFVFGLISEFL